MAVRTKTQSQRQFGTGVFFPAPDTVEVRTANTVQVQVNAAGQALFRSGVATLPAIAFAVDPDVGLIYTASGEIGAVTAGVERLRFSAAQVDGFGTTGSRVQFRGNNDAAATQAASSVEGFLTTTVAGAETGALAFLTVNAGGVLTERGRWTGPGALLVGATAVLAAEQFRVTGGESAFDFTGTNALWTALTGSSTPRGLAVDTTNGRIGVGTTASTPAVAVHVTVDDGNNATQTEMLRLVHTTSGVPAAGIGTRISHFAENSAGTSFETAREEGVLTTVTAGSERSAWIVSVVDSTGMSSRIRASEAGVKFGSVGSSNPTAVADIVGFAATSATFNPLFRATGGAHTGLTAAESIDVDYALNRSVQFTTGGAIAQQRAFVVRPPTYTATAATQTLTDAATLAIEAAPTAGTNVAITNSYSLWVQAGDTRLDGNVGLGAAPVAKLDVAGNLALRAVSPAALAAGTTNNYAGAAGRTWVRLAANALGSTVTGFTGGVDGALMIVLNLGSGSLTLSHQNTGSSAANRMITTTGLDVVLTTDGIASFIYDSGTSRWRQISGVW